MIAASAQALEMLERGVFARRYLVKAELGNGTYGVWNDDHNITFEAQEYIGLQNFGVSNVTTSKDGSVDGLTLTFSGLDGHALALIDDDDWHQKPIYVRQMYISTEDGQVLLVKPVFAGRIDAAVRKDTGDGMALIEISCESFERDIQRKVGGTRSSANQALRDPMDKFFSHVGAATQTPINWGR